MNDPHVAALKYQVVVDDSLEFRDPPDVAINRPEFTGRLSKGVLTLELREHFETESQVRPMADAYVLAWEIDAGLRYGRPWFRFRFKRSEITDRKPTPGALKGSARGSATASGSLSGSLSAYPDPPRDFAVTPEVEILWARYCRYSPNRTLTKFVGRDAADGFNSRWSRPLLAHDFQSRAALQGGPFCGDDVICCGSNIKN